MKVLIIWNCLTFLITLYDKIAAKILPKNRVPEKILFGLAVCGGGVGVTVGFLALRHKIRKPLLFWPTVAVTALEAAVFWLIYPK